MSYSEADNISSDAKSLTFLKEGKSYHFYDIKKIKLIKFVPWDLAALLYYHFHILKKEQVKPEK